MSVFQFSSYKVFLNAWIQSQPKKGHGQQVRIAQLLNIHTTMVTHVLKGDSNLTTEHALKIAGMLGLSEAETDFFVMLVQLERAADEASRRYFRSKLEEARARSQNIGQRLREKKVLGEKEQARFYSSWMYSAARLSVALKGATLDGVARKLGIPPKKARLIFEFLIETGLVVEKSGALEVGESRTYVGRDSPYVHRHHINWRLRAIDSLEKELPADLHFTNPITVSRQDFELIREQIIKFLEEYQQTADPSEPEELCCLNIDWFKV